MIIAIIGLVLLILFSAFFSSAEMVYSKVNRLSLKKAAENKEKLAIQANSFVENYPKLLSSLLVGNNLVNIAASSIATALCIEWFDTPYAPTIAAVGMLVILLTFGEILPKSIGAKFNYRLSLIFAIPLKIISFILTPITFFVNKLVSYPAKLWEKKENEPSYTDDELLKMVDSIEEDGLIDDKQSELIKSAIEFTDATAHEIMIPRVDVFAFDIDDDVSKLTHDKNIFNHSRIPVYKDSLDDVIGILNTKHLLKAMLANKEINIKEILTEPLYVYKTQPISSILKELKESHRHLAIIKDEFGGTMGILTMEDILEELVGDILDETDPIEEDYHKIDDNTYIVDGAMNIYDFFDLVDYDDKDFESEYTTIGGWSTEMLEKFPEVNDTFTFENYLFTILEVEEFRVEKIQVQILPREEDE